MKNLEIIDNFLDEKDYQQIYAIMLSPNFGWHVQIGKTYYADFSNCLLYTSPSPRDGLLSRMPSSA